MFCDLIGSTVLSTRMDPEDTQQILRQYHDLCGALIDQHDGYLAQHLGDGVLAYFGHPEAHEDDASRAISTALQIIAEVIQLIPAVPLPDGFALGVRIGIHTGEVVTADVGRKQQASPLALGDVPNIAARLQGLAERNCVVISESTHALALHDFEYAHLGLKEIRGARPIEVYQPLRRASTRERFHAVHRTPMVGRDRELARLLGKLREAAATGAQAIRVVGEPGIGKTRLALALEDSLALEPHTWLVCRCYSEGRGSFLHPIADLLADWAGLSGDLDPAAQLDRVQQKLGELLRRPVEARSHALFHLLNLPNPNGAPWLKGRPEDQKQQIFGAIIDWFVAQSEAGPLVLMVEDFHWVDPSTAELIGRILPALGDAQALFVLLQRPEGPVIDPLPEIDVLRLEPLSPAASMQLIAQCSTGILADTASAIVARADGIPLFVQELTRQAAFERDGSGAGSPGPRLPDRVRDLFTTQLDRLGDSRRIAAMAAVIGPEFSAALLSRVAQLEAAALEDHLDVLTREAVIARAERGDAYVFKHALIRDAALANILRRNLRTYHRRVAESLELYHPEEIALRPERLARHWGHANLIARALPYFSSAADRARSVYANAEAISLYQEALQFGQPPESPGAARESLASLSDIQEGLGDVLALMRRNGEAVEILNSALARVDRGDRIRRARLHRKAAMASREREPHGIPGLLEALEELGETPGAHPEHWWTEWLQTKFELSITFYQLGRVDEMMQVAREIEPLVRDHGTPHQQAELANQLLLLDRRLHRFAATPASLTYSRAFMDAAERAGDEALHAAASAAHAMTLMDHDLFGESEVEFAHALTLSRRTGHRSAEVRALAYFAVLRRRQGLVDEAVSLSEQAKALADAANMPVYVSTGDANLAWAAWRRRELDTAIELGERALAGLDRASARSPFFWIAALPLAAACLSRGDFTRGAEHLARMTRRDQQMLSSDLMAAIEAVGQAVDVGPQGLEPALSAALTLAQQRHYL
jgi:class 3 adenylate cyclase